MRRLRGLGGRGRGVRLSRSSLPAQFNSRARSPRHRVLLVAANHSYRIPAYQAAAAALGVRLVIASDGANSVIPQITDGVHIDIRSATDAATRIIEAARLRPIDAVVATDDSTVEIASRVAAALGLAHNPVTAGMTARRKDLARETLAAAGVPVPEFRRLDLRRPLPPQITGMRYPCVVKPLAMAASRGVIRADDPESLARACRRVGAIIAAADNEDERNNVLVESFIPGPEIALEGLLFGGQLMELAVFDKPDPLDGPFFEETYYVTPSQLDPALLARARRRVAESCAAYGLREGPVHAEIRIHRGDAWIIEVAARTIGGDCARLLTSRLGRSLEELVLRHALGWPLALEERAGAAGVLMMPTPGAGTLRRVEGVLAAAQVPGIEDVVIAVREGYELVPLPEGGSYLGFVFARGTTPAEVEGALRSAHTCMNVVIAPSLKVTSVPPPG